MPLQLAHVITLAWPFGVNIMSIMNCLAARVGEPPHRSTLPGHAERRCAVHTTAHAADPPGAILHPDWRLLLSVWRPRCPCQLVTSAIFLRFTTLTDIWSCILTLVGHLLQAHRRLPRCCGRARLRAD